MNFADRGKEQTVGGRLVGDWKSGFLPRTKRRKGVSEVEERKGREGTFFSV